MLVSSHDSAIFYGPRSPRSDAARSVIHRARILGDFVARPLAVPADLVLDLAQQPSTKGTPAPPPHLTLHATCGLTFPKGSYLLRETPAPISDC